MIEKPTVKELLKHAENRYALVIATSKRAREISKGDKILVDSDETAPVTIAANEIVEGKVTICGDSVVESEETVIEEIEKEEV